MARHPLLIVVALIAASRPVAAQDAPQPPRITIGTAAWRLPRVGLHVAWSPRGRFVAAGGTVVDAKTGAVLWSVPGPRRLGPALAWSPRGDILASRGDRSIDLRKAGTGERVLSIRARFRPTALVWSPGGLRLAVGDFEGRLHLFSPKGERLGEPVSDRDGEIEALAFSPDGDRIATGGSNGVVHVRKVADPSNAVRLPGTGKPVRAVAWSRDEKTLAVAGDDPFVTLRDGLTGEELRRLSVAPYGRQALGVRSLSFSPDGSRLATSGATGRLLVLDVKTGAVLARHRRSRHTQGYATFSPDGSRIASVWGAVLHVRDAETGALPANFHGHEDEITALAFSTDRKVLAAGDRAGVVRLWDTATGKELRSNTAHVGDVLRITWGGALIATSGEDGKAFTWNAADGKKVAELPRINLNYGAIAFSPKLDRIAFDRGVCDPRTGNVLTWYHEASGHTSRLEWSPDGTRILDSGCLRRRGGFPVHDAAEGGVLLRLPYLVNQTPELFWRDDGRRIVALDNGLEVIWDAKTGKEVRRRKLTYRKTSGDPAWSPDGRFALLSTGEIVGLERDELSARLDVSGIGRVEALVWSPDGRVIAVGTESGRIAIFDRPVEQDR